MRNDTESNGLQTTIFAQYIGTLTKLDPNNEALELVPNIEDVTWVTSPVRLPQVSHFEGLPAMHSPNLSCLTSKKVWGLTLLLYIVCFFFKHLLLSFLTFFCLLFVFCLPCFLLSPISFSVGPSLLLFMFSHFLLFLHT